jgi:hypothetical protein
VTSPTGLKNFKDLSGIDLSIDIWDCLEKKNTTTSQDHFTPNK